MLRVCCSKDVKRCHLRKLGGVYINNQRSNSSIKVIHDHRAEEDYPTIANFETVGPQFWEYRGCTQLRRTQATQWILEWVSRIA